MGLEPEIKRLFEYEFESEIAIGINWVCNLSLRLSLRARHVIWVQIEIAIQKTKKDTNRW